MSYIVPRAVPGVDWGSPWSVVSEVVQKVIWSGVGQAIRRATYVVVSYVVCRIVVSTQQAVAREAARRGTLLVVSTIIPSAIR
jgi:hypothetical protein